MDSKVCLLACAVLFATLFVSVNGHASSWMVYAEMKNTDVVTYMNTTVVVPPAPLKSGATPAFWPGLEDTGEKSVIQPILKWINFDWYIFNEYVTPEGRDYQSFHYKVKPGDTIFMEIAYNQTTASYVMLVRSEDTGYEDQLSYSPEPGYRYTDAYFSMEHQPRTCNQYPPSNNITFFDTNMAVNGNPVVPVWTTGQVNPACDSTVNIISPSVVQFLWKS